VIKVVFLLLLMLGTFAYAEGSATSTRVYSGYLHKYNSKSHRSFLGAIFGAKPAPEQVNQDNICSLEFRCPASNPRQPTVVVPEALTYFIRFSAPKGPSFQQDNVSGKLIIKIYANDGEEYLLDPDSEGKKDGLKGEHHLYDMYLIYLILSQSINHFEVVSVSASSQDIYVLDKLEIN
jgi:hypothetical protein